MASESWLGIFFTQVVTMFIKTYIFVKVREGKGRGGKEGKGREGKEGRKEGRKGIFGCLGTMKIRNGHEQL